MNENKRMSSIARKMNWLFIRKILYNFLIIDFIILILAISLWCYSIEVENLGIFKLNSDRNFEFINSAKIIYHVTIKDGASISINADTFVFIMKRIIIIVGIMEILTLIKSMLFDTRLIRQKLKPLHEIAQKAEALSSIAFDEKKFQNLEDAISNLSPDSPDAIIHTKDKDLQGIEISLNNLLNRMRDSYRQQSRFVSDASHELRTPIAVIKGYVDMLDRWGKEDETVLDESIQAIKHESDHMNKLVEQLLFLARGDSGHNKMNFEDFSLTAMIHEVYVESKMIDTKHIYELIESDNVTINGDIAMLKQSVRILVDNAAKYTLENDVITIRSGINSNGEAYFSVQDNGIGMCDSHISHIFERFYRADLARNQYSGGTGLGLSIAKWIIDKHHGYFDILSRPDIGTRITVIIKKL